MPMNQVMEKQIAKINQDVKILKNISSGSGASIFLCSKEQQILYRKIATAKSGDANKLHAQLKWILAHQQRFPLPKIGDYHYDGDVCWYDMLAHENCINLSNYLESHATADAWRVLHSVIETIQDQYTVNLSPANSKAIADYITAKVHGNAQRIMNDSGELIQALQKFSELIINGKTYKNLGYYLGEHGILAGDRLKQVFADDQCCDIHGDLTLENIIYDSDSAHGFYLIDPNPVNLHGTYLLDYAKLLQSLHGNYENLQQVQTVKIKQNQIDFDLNESQTHAEIYRLYDAYLKNAFSSAVYKSIYHHEIVHWFRLLPYQIKKDPKRAVIYYCQTLILLDELAKKFEN